MENMAKPTIVPGRGVAASPLRPARSRERSYRALDALAARRRRLPMLTFGDNDMFETPAGRDRLAEAGVTWVSVSNMPLAQIEPCKARMGWTFPFVSSHGTSFSDACGAGPGFVLSVFLHDGTDVANITDTT
jgi:predicted dithiol-disulfide oxidoreductase (DUF899 family)